MKNLFENISLLLAICFLLLAVCMAETITVNYKNGCSIRNEPIPEKGSKPIATAKYGDTFEVTGVYCDYVEVWVIEGKNKAETSTHAGDKGFMWAKRVDIENGYVIIEGCTLRSTPTAKDNAGTPADTSDDPNFVAKIKKGAKLKIIKVLTTWYNTKAGWIYSGCVSVN